MYLIRLQNKTRLRPLAVSHQLPHTADLAHLPPSARQFTVVAIPMAGAVSTVPPLKPIVATTNTMPQLSRLSTSRTILVDRHPIPLFQHLPVASFPQLAIFLLPPTTVHFQHHPPTSLRHPYSLHPSKRQLMLPLLTVTYSTTNSQQPTRNLTKSMATTSTPTPANISMVESLMTNSGKATTIA